MSLSPQHAVLTLAAFSALLLAARYRSRPEAVAPATTVTLSPPPATPIEVKPRKKAPRLLAKVIDTRPKPPREERGARLRDKGEAFGGQAPERVDAPATKR